MYIGICRKCRRLCINVIGSHKERFHKDEDVDVGKTQEYWFSMMHEDGERPLVGQAPLLAF